MTQTILKKAIDELKLATPRLDYVLGMLETLHEMGEEPISVKEYKDIVTFKDGYSKVSSILPTTEAEILDARAKAAINTVKELGQLS